MSASAPVAPTAPPAPVTSAARGTIADLLAATMRDLQVEHVFTLMGAGNLRLIHHLAAHYGVDVHHLRHENSAIGAADGYARVTGQVGWCTVTQGPGFTNALTALVTAEKARTPMVLVTVDSSNLPERSAPFASGIQGLDPEVLLRPLGVTVIRAHRESAAEDLVAAARRAARESRPVVYVLPAGLDSQPAATMTPPSVGGLTGDEPVSSPLSPEPDAVTTAARTLRDARRPLVLAGRGAVASGAGPALQRVAELCGAHLATSIRAAGLFHGAPGDLGICGGFSSTASAETIQAADVILAVGVSVNLFQTRKGALVEGATIIHVGNDPEQLGRYETPTMTIVGDALLTAEALVTELERQPVPSGPPPSGGGTQPFTDISSPGALDPRQVTLALDQLLPVDRTVVIDNGHFGSFPIMHLIHTDPSRLVWLSDFGAIGSAIGSAIAAAVARPERTTVLFIGDCGFYMTLGDFETAVRERVPLLVVCMNDGAAGSELQHMKDWDVPGDEAIFGIADLASAARGMGAQGATVLRVDDIKPALAGWQRDQGPLLLDVHITRAVRAPIYDHV